MPAADILPSEVGSPLAGFRSAGLPLAGLRIEVWGYWTPDLALAFRRDVPDLVQKLGMEASFVLEAAELKPQATEGQEAMRALFRALSGTSLSKATLKTNNVLTRMQLTRLVRECGLDARAVFE
jgi:hypothetical protein